MILRCIFSKIFFKCVTKQAAYSLYWCKCLLGDGKLGKSKEHNLIDESFRELAIPLYKFVFNILKKQHDAEDIVSDTFVRTLEIVYSSNELPQRPLYFTIARNLAIDFLRRRKKINYNSEVIENITIADDTDVFDEVNRIAENEEVEKLIGTLPDVYANVFYLRFSQYLSFEEIGKVMDMSENNARVIYFRARTKLKKMIAEKKES